MRIEETASGGKLVHRPNNGNMPFLGTPDADYFYPWERVDQDGDLIEDDFPSGGPARPRAPSPKAPVARSQRQLVPP